MQDLLQSRTRCIYIYMTCQKIDKCEHNIYQGKTANSSVKPIRKSFDLISMVVHEKK